MTGNRIAAGAAACCAVILVSGCGGGTAATVGAASSTPTTAAPDRTPIAPGGGAGGAARSVPGATGVLAQISGRQLQVQGADTQTTVSYSSATTFTSTVAAKASDVEVGVCIQARSAQPVAGKGGAAPTADPSPSAVPITAASIEISPAVNGTCSAFGGDRPPRTGSPAPGAEATPPAGAPPAGRNRGPGTAGTGFGGLGAFGKVMDVSDAGLTLESSRPASGTATTATPTFQTIKTAAGTTYTRTRVANAKALVLGLCVTARGRASDTGSITATSIMLRQSENGSCSWGPGGRGPSGAASSTGAGSGA